MTSISIANIVASKKEQLLSAMQDSSHRELCVTWYLLGHQQNTVSLYKDAVKQGEVNAEVACRGALDMSINVAQTGPLYYWRKELVELTNTAALQLPESAAVSATMLPTSSGLLFFQKPFENRVVENQGVWQAVHAITWFCKNDFVWVSFLGELYLLNAEGETTSVSNALLSTWGFRLGVGLLRELPKRIEKLQAGYERLVIGRIYCLFSFLNEKVFRTVAVNPSKRQCRLLVARGASSTEVRVITLRGVRSEYVGEKHESQIIDWKYRWLVRGHWRSQYYPSEQLNRPIWIYPYMKGPEDKPIKTPEQLIFDVSR